MKRFTKISLCAAVVAASLATTAQAEEASTTVNVYAGLASVMELTCSDVSFGVWRVPTGSRAGGTTTITLVEGGTASTTTGGDGVALSVAHVSHAPKAGECTVSGSSKVSGDGAANIGGGIADITGSFVAAGADDEFFTGLKVPTTALTALNYTLRLSNYTPTVTGSGGTIFKVFGEMVIPNDLGSSNYGGYKAGTIAVSFDDTNAS